MSKAISGHTRPSRLNVEDDGDAAVVGGADEVLQGVRASVGLLDGEDVRRVVATREVRGELNRGHELDRRDAQLPQVVEAIAHAVEAAGAATGLVVERSNVQLVD